VSLTSSSPLVRSAWEFARETHAGQRREVDGAPFVLHPLEVALLLRGADAGDPVIAAGLLHDAIEHGGATVDGLEAAFGPHVARLVADVTEDAGVAGYPERKRGLRERASAAELDSVLLFAADKISKARDLRSEAAGGELDARRAACRHHHYAESLEIVGRRAPGHALTELLRLEMLELALMPVLSWLPASPPACLAG
jgi:(p)ppGpp synthase/HD superfamily hydrolase